MSNLDSLPCTEKLLNVMFTTKSDNLNRVCMEIGCTRHELHELLVELFQESKMHLGACTLALDKLTAAADSQAICTDIRQAVLDSIRHTVSSYNARGESPLYPHSFE